MLRPILSALLFAAAALPAGAQVTVTHHIEGRFGVSYVSNADGTSEARPLYEGIYTTTFAHDFDNGVRFRFDLGLSLGNFDSSEHGQHYPMPAWPASGN